MRNLRFLIPCLLPALTGCAWFSSPPAEVDAKAQMVGMSKDEIAVCIGQPNKKSVQGNVETWSYTYDVCEVELTLVSDTVKASRYHVPDDPDRTVAEQCDHVPVVAACLRWLRR